MSYETLCQDCMRVVSFDSVEQRDRAHMCEVQCVCGGDLCACPHCLSDILLLQQSARTTPYVLGTFASWSAKGGVVGFVRCPHCKAIGDKCQACRSVEVA